MFALRRAAGFVSGSGVAAAVINLSSSSSACEDAPEDSQKPFFAVFLNAESRERLKALFPAKFAHQYGDHMTVAWNPSEETYKELQPLCGTEFELSVVGVGEDSFGQAAVVRVNGDPAQGAIVENDYPHVTLSTVGGEDRFGAKYSNTLLGRLAASTQRAALLSHGSSAGTTEWSGTLPSFGGEEGADEFSGFPETQASLRVLERDSVKLTGTLCFSQLWDAEEDRCTERECGFCKFMKAGPCGAEFEVWEKCIESCRDDEEGDFVMKCADETLLLKTCVDLHPEYYGILGDDEEEEKKEEEGDADADLLGAPLGAPLGGPLGVPAVSQPASSDAAVSLAGDEEQKTAVVEEDESGPAAEAEAEGTEEEETAPAVDVQVEAETAPSKPPTAPGVLRWERKAIGAKPTLVRDD